MSSYVLPDADMILDAHVAGGRAYVLKIKDMPPEDRPREKLLKQGAEALSIHELLAVIFVTGTKDEDVLTLTSRILKEYGERSLVSQKNPAQMSKDLNIPMNKSLQILACAELGRRFFGQKETGLAVIRTANDVYSYAGEMQKLPKEHLRGIYLNAHHRVIHDEVISIGTINSNLIHPREVFKPAIEYGAVAVVLVHNHPSGVANPSEPDVEITKQLVAAGKILGIHLVDHVVVGKDSFKSVAVDY